jgi:hypothetical protein
MNNMGREIMAALKRFQVGSDGDGVTVGGALVVSGSTTANTFSATAVNATGTVTFSGSVILSGTTTANTFSTDLITEKTSAAGVTVDGVLLKDSQITTDQINEKTSAAGVTVDGVLLKDTGVGSAASPVTLNSLAYPTEGSVNFRNRIINGDMRIDQRNAGAAVTLTADLFVVDRFYARTQSATNSTAQRSTTAPSGFNNSLLVTIGTGASPSSSATNAIRQEIEGFNVADLGWGTASAKTVTISFWVRSSLTGTFGGALSNAGLNRAYPYTYSISSANTWEYKTITIPGDTSGTWATDNSSGIRFWVDLGTGTDRQGTAGSWAAADYRAASGCVQLVATTGATLNITGVQLEVGSVATPFERRPYGTELALCQRYCVNYRSADSSGVYYRYGTGQCDTTANSDVMVIYPVPMRVTPTLTTTGTASNYAVYQGGVVTACSAVPTINANSSFLHATINGTVASGLTVGRAGSILSNNNNTSYLLFSAEL